MMMLLDGEEGLECGVCVQGLWLEHLSEVKYFGCVLRESGTNEAECPWKGRVKGGLQMLGVCSLSVLGSCMSQYLCLFLCVVVGK